MTHIGWKIAKGDQERTHRVHAGIEALWNDEGLDLELRAIGLYTVTDLPTLACIRKDECEAAGTPEERTQGGIAGGGCRVFFGGGDPPPERNARWIFGGTAWHVYQSSDRERRGRTASGHLQGERVDGTRSARPKRRARALPGGETQYAERNPGMTPGRSPGEGPKGEHANVPRLSAKEDPAGGRSERDSDTESGPHGPGERGRADRRRRTRRACGTWPRTLGG